MSNHAPRDSEASTSVFPREKPAHAQGENSMGHAGSFPAREGSQVVVVFGRKAGPEGSGCGPGVVAGVQAIAVGVFSEVFTESQRNTYANRLAHSLFPVIADALLGLCTVSKPAQINGRKLCAHESHQPEADPCSPNASVMSSSQD
eukprot:1332917-Rhodomonas_salina.3